MREGISRFVPRNAGPLQIIEIRIEPDSAQRYYNIHALQYSQFAIEEWRAVSEFRRQRLVVGRRAADSRGDVAVHQFQSVVAMLGIGLRCKAKLVQNGIHEFSRRIPSKRPAGAVGTVGSRRQSQHQHAGMGIAESRYRSRPIFTIAIGTALLPANLLTIGHQTRTPLTVHNFLVQHRESGSHSSHCSDRMENKRESLSHAMYSTPTPVKASYSPPNRFQLQASTRIRKSTASSDVKEKLTNVNCPAGCSVTVVGRVVPVVAVQPRVGLLPVKWSGLDRAHSCYSVTARPHLKICRFHETGNPAPAHSDVLHHADDLRICIRAALRGLLGADSRRNHRPTLGPADPAIAAGAIPRCLAAGPGKSSCLCLRRQRRPGHWLLSLR